MLPESSSSPSDSLGAHLRNMALTTPVEALGFSADAEYPEVYGVLVDWPIDKKTVASILAMRNGTSSLYTTTSFGVIGGEMHASTRQAAERCVRVAADCLASSEHVADYPLPAKGRVHFYLLTYNGVRLCTSAEAGLVRGADPLGVLFNAAQVLMAQLRRQTQDAKGDGWRSRASRLFSSRMSPAQLLSNAVVGHDLAEVEAQLAAGADANACSPDHTPVIAVAASHGWSDIVGALLAAGADPSMHIRTGKRGAFRGPLLCLPAANGSLETARTLISAGADVDAADASGLTPLMCASRQGHEAIIRLLLEAGAMLELRDQEGYTALMFAANRGQTAVTGILLAAGADVNAAASDGSTPVMFAAQHGYEETVKTLLAAGADPSVTGRHGLSAIGFAKQNSHIYTLALLLEAARDNR